jgi:hypothetical protein
LCAGYDNQGRIWLRKQLGLVGSRCPSRPLRQRLFVRLQIVKFANLLDDTLAIWTIPEFAYLPDDTLAIWSIPKFAYLLDDTLAIWSISEFSDPLDELPTPALAPVV